MLRYTIHIYTTKEFCDDCHGVVMCNMLCGQRSPIEPAGVNSDAVWRGWKSNGFCAKDAGFAAIESVQFVHFFWEIKR